MKKIVSLVLVVMLAVTAVFAEPVVSKAYIGETEYDMITDTEYEVLNPGKLTDEQLVEFCRTYFPDEMAGKKYYYVYHIFNDEWNDAVKKYPQYWLLSKDRGYIFTDFALSDGRMLRILYMVESN